MSRTETALGTPYYSPDGLVTGISSVSLIIGSQTEKYLGEPLHRPRAIYLSEDITDTNFVLNIELNEKSVKQGISELGISNKGIELIALLRVPSLRTYEILLRKNLASISKYSLQIESNNFQKDLMFLGKSTAISISVYLVIGEKSKARIFFPPPPGTWLSGIGFKIQPPQLSLEFSPEELTQEQAKLLNIPIDTFVYVDFLEENASFPLLEISDVKDALTVYVNQSLFQSLIDSTDQGKRAMLVSSILSAAINQIIFQLSFELQENISINYEQVKDRKPVALKIIDKITPKNMEPEMMLEIIKKFPAQAIAYADSESKTAEIMKEIM